MIKAITQATKATKGNDSGTIPGSNYGGSKPQK